MTESATAGVKRKRPPTFPHLPADRAKKFKKAWVEKTKIKSKWKSQKRKEGLADSSKLEIPVYDDEPDEGRPVDREQSEGFPGPNDVLKDVPPRSNRGRHHVHPSRSHIHPELTVKESKIPEPRPTKRQRVSNDQQPPEGDNIRDLMREAYSKSTLHTFKADPLKKRGGVAGAKGEKGRGQPNMKLRMNAMLAKIEQDHP